MDCNGVGVACTWPKVSVVSRSFASNVLSITVASESGMAQDLAHEHTLHHGPSRLVTLEPKRVWVAVRMSEIGHKGLATVLEVLYIGIVGQYVSWGNPIHVLWMAERV